MFVEFNIENVINHLSKLSAESKPQWGTMNAQRMVEHLTDSIQVATGKNPQALAIPEDKIEKSQAWLESDKPMPKNFEVSFASNDIPNRNEEIELAIDELVEEILFYDELFESDPTRKVVHPYYGALNYEQWNRLNEKHFTHHYEQFGLID